MGKVNQVQNNDPGIVCRTYWNEAMREAETTASIDGDGTVGSPLSTVVDNDCDLPSDSTIIPPSVEAVKCYIQEQISSLIGFFTWKSFSFKTNPGSSGVDYAAGYYDASESDANLDEGSTTVTWGTLDVTYGARFFIVAGGPAVTDGTTVTLTITGASIDDFGNFNGADSEVLVLDATTVATNDYFQTTKQWVGIVTATLSSDGTIFNFDFNYGFAKFEENLPAGFIIQGVEVVGLARGDDFGFDWQLIVHDPTTGWVYSPAAFAPNNLPSSIITSIVTIQGSYQRLESNEYFAFHHLDIGYALPPGAGVLVRIITTSNNPVNHMDIHVKASF